MIPEGQLASVNSGLLVPWLPGPPLYADSFRCNVRELLHLYGRKVPLNGLRRATAYIVELESPKGVTRLHVYEEKLDEKDGAVCDQCRCMGWQHHPVCNSKYHFIIPSEATLEDTKQLTAVVEGIYLKRLPLTFKWTAPSPDEQDDDEVGPYNSAASVFESQDHLLHGVLHLNGYGHLLRMNGSQGGSRRLIGKQLLTIWDRICVLLRAREVSTEDVSNKSGMLLRVLHTAAFGTTWYGKMGYKFGRGSFNIKPEQYAAAVAAVQSTPLSAIAADFQAVQGMGHCSDGTLQAILQHYTGRGEPVTTLGQLLKRLLTWCARPDEYAALYPAPPGWREPPPYMQLLWKEGRPRSGGFRGNKRVRSLTASPLPSASHATVKAEQPSSAGAGGGGARHAIHTPRRAAAASEALSPSAATAIADRRGWPSIVPPVASPTAAMHFAMGQESVVPGSPVTAAGPDFISGSCGMSFNSLPASGRGARVRRSKVYEPVNQTAAAGLKGIRQSTRVAAVQSAAAASDGDNGPGFVCPQRSPSGHDVASLSPVANSLLQTPAPRAADMQDWNTKQQQQQPPPTLPAASDSIAAALAAAAALSAMTSAVAAPTEGVATVPTTAAEAFHPPPQPSADDSAAGYAHPLLPAAEEMAADVPAASFAPAAVEPPAAAAVEEKNSIMPRPSSQEPAVRARSTAGWNRTAVMLGIVGEQAAVENNHPGGLPPAKRVRVRGPSAAAAAAAAAAVEEADISAAFSSPVQTAVEGVTADGPLDTEQLPPEHNSDQRAQQGDPAILGTAEQAAGASSQLLSLQQLPEQQHHVEICDWPGRASTKGRRSHRTPSWRTQGDQHQQQHQQHHQHQSTPDMVLQLLQPPQQLPPSQLTPQQDSQHPTQLIQQANVAAAALVGAAERHDASAPTLGPDNQEQTAAVAGSPDASLSRFAHPAQQTDEFSLPHAFRSGPTFTHQGIKHLPAAAAAAAEESEMQSPVAAVFGEAATAAGFDTTSIRAAGGSDIDRAAADDCGSAQKLEWQQQGLLGAGVTSGLIQTALPADDPAAAAAAGCGDVDLSAQRVLYDPSSGATASPAFEATAAAPVLLSSSDERQAAQSQQDAPGAAAAGEGATGPADFLVAVSAQQPVGLNRSLQQQMQQEQQQHLQEVYNDHHKQQQQQQHIGDAAAANMQAVFSDPGGCSHQQPKQLEGRYSPADEQLPEHLDLHQQQQLEQQESSQHVAAAATGERQPAADPGLQLGVAPEELPLASTAAAAAGSRDMVPAADAAAAPLGMPVCHTVGSSEQNTAQEAAAGAADTVPANATFVGPAAEGTQDAVVAEDVGASLAAMAQHAAEQAVLGDNDAAQAANEQQEAVLSQDDQPANADTAVAAVEEPSHIQHALADADMQPPAAAPSDVQLADNAFTVADGPPAVLVDTAVALAQSAPITVADDVTRKQQAAAAAAELAKPLAVQSQAGRAVKARRSIGSGASATIEGRLTRQQQLQQEQQQQQTQQHEQAESRYQEQQQLASVDGQAQGLQQGPHNQQQQVSALDHAPAASSGKNVRDSGRGRRSNAGTAADDDDDVGFGVLQNQASRQSDSQSQQKAVDPDPAEAAALVVVAFPQTSIQSEQAGGPAASAPPPAAAPVKAEPQQQKHAEPTAAPAAAAAASGGTGRAGRGSRRGIKGKGSTAEAEAATAAAVSKDTAPSSSAAAVDATEATAAESAQTPVASKAVVDDTDPGYTSGGSSHKKVDWSFMKYLPRRATRHGQQQTDTEDDGPDSQAAANTPPSAAAAAADAEVKQQKQPAKQSGNAAAKAASRKPKGKQAAAAPAAAAADPVVEQEQAAAAEDSSQPAAAAASAPAAASGSKAKQQKGKKQPQPPEQAAAADGSQPAAGAAASPVKQDGRHKDWSYLQHAPRRATRAQQAAENQAAEPDGQAAAAAVEQQQLAEDQQSTEGKRPAKQQKGKKPQRQAPSSNDVAEDQDNAAVGADAAAGDAQQPARGKARAKLQKSQQQQQQHVSAAVDPHLGTAAEHQIAHHADAGADEPAVQQPAPDTEQPKGKASTRQQKTKKQQQQSAAATDSQSGATAALLIGDHADAAEAAQQVAADPQHSGKTRPTSKQQKGKKQQQQPAAATKLQSGTDVELQLPDHVAEAAQDPAADPQQSGRKKASAKQQKGKKQLQLAAEHQSADKVQPPQVQHTADATAADAAAQTIDMATQQLGITDSIAGQHESKQEQQLAAAASEPQSTAAADSEAQQPIAEAQQPARGKTTLKQQKGKKQQQQNAAQAEPPVAAVVNPQPEYHLGAVAAESSVQQQASETQQPASTKAVAKQQKGKQQQQQSTAATDHEFASCAAPEAPADTAAAVDTTGEAAGQQIGAGAQEPAQAEADTDQQHGTAAQQAAAITQAEPADTVPADQMVVEAENPVTDQAAAPEVAAAAAAGVSAQQLLAHQQHTPEQQGQQADAAVAAAEAQEQQQQQVRHSTRPRKIGYPLSEPPDLLAGKGPIIAAKQAVAEAFPPTPMRKVKPPAQRPLQYAAPGSAAVAIGLPPRMLSPPVEIPRVEGMRFSSRKRSPSIRLKDSVVAGPGTAAVSARAAADWYEEAATPMEHQQQAAVAPGPFQPGAAGDGGVDVDVAGAQQQQQQLESAQPLSELQAASHLRHQRQGHNEQAAAVATAAAPTGTAAPADGAGGTTQQQGAGRATGTAAAAAAGEGLAAGADGVGGGGPAAVASASGAATSGSSKTGQQKRRKKSTLFTTKTKKRGWRWVVKPQYVLDEEAAKKAWQAAAKKAKEPGAGPADVAATEAAYQEYQARKAITEHELANYKEADPQPVQQQLMPPPPSVPAAAAAQPKKYKLKFKQPVGLKSGGKPVVAKPAAATNSRAPAKQQAAFQQQQPYPAAAAAAAQASLRKSASAYHRSAAYKAQELAADAAWFIGSPSPTAAAAAAEADPNAAAAAPGAHDTPDPADSAAAAGEQELPADVSLLGVSFHGRKRKASVAVREAVEGATEAAAARQSKRVRVRSSQLDEGDFAGVYAAAAAATVRDRSGNLLAGLGSRHFAVAAPGLGEADAAANQSEAQQQTARDAAAAAVLQQQLMRRNLSAVRKNPRNRSAQGKSLAEGDDLDFDFTAAVLSSSRKYRRSGSAYQRRLSLDNTHLGDAGSHNRGSRPHGLEPPAMFPEPHHPELKSGLLPRSVPGIRTADQILADLQFIYNNVLRIYKPQQVLDHPPPQQQQQQQAGSAAAVHDPPPAAATAKSSAPKRESSRLTVKHDRLSSLTVKDRTLSDLSLSDSPAADSSEQQQSEEPQQQHKQKQKTQSQVSGPRRVDGGTCANCGVNHTTCWRKDRSTPARQLCNACGLYKYKNGIDRPLTPGNRLPGRSGSGGFKGAGNSSGKGPKGKSLLGKPSSSQQQQPEAPQILALEESVAQQQLAQQQPTQQQPMQQQQQLDSQQQHLQQQMLCQQPQQCFDGMQLPSLPICAPMGHAPATSAAAMGPMGLPYLQQQQQQQQYYPAAGLSGPGSVSLPSTAPLLPGYPYLAAQYSPHSSAGPVYGFATSGLSNAQLWPSAITTAGPPPLVSSDVTTADLQLPVSFTQLLASPTAPAPAATADAVMAAAGGNDGVQQYAQAPPDVPTTAAAAASSGMAVDAVMESANADVEITHVEQQQQEHQIPHSTAAAPAAAPGTHQAAGDHLAVEGQANAVLGNAEDSNGVEGNAAAAAEEQVFDVVHSDCPVLLNQAGHSEVATDPGPAVQQMTQGSAELQQQQQQQQQAVVATHAAGGAVAAAANDTALTGEVTTTSSETFPSARVAVSGGVPGAESLNWASPQQMELESAAAAAAGADLPVGQQVDLDVGPSAAVAAGDGSGGGDGGGDGGGNGGGELHLGQPADLDAAVTFGDDRTAADDTGNTASAAEAPPTMPDGAGTAERVAAAPVAVAQTAAAPVTHAEEAAAPAAAASADIKPKPELQLKNFMQTVQTVRDIKHLVKDYQGELPPEGYDPLKDEPKQPRQQQQQEVEQQQPHKPALLVPQLLLPDQLLQQQERQQQERQEQQQPPTAEPMGLPSSDVAAALAAAAAAVSSAPVTHHNALQKREQPCGISMDVDMTGSAAAVTGSDSDEMVVPEQPGQPQQQQQQQQQSGMQYQQQSQGLHVQSGDAWMQDHQLPATAMTQATIVDTALPEHFLAHAQQQQQLSDQLNDLHAPAGLTAAAGAADLMQVDDQHHQQQQHGFPADQLADQVGPRSTTAAAAVPVASIAAAPSEAAAAQLQTPEAAASDPQSTRPPFLQPDVQQQQQQASITPQRPVANVVQQQQQQQQGNLLAALRERRKVQSRIRLLVQLDLSASGLLDVCVVQLPNKQLHRRHRHTHITPPELILVPYDCTLADAKRYITDTFAEIYRCAVHWKCENITGWPPGALVPAGTDEVSAGNKQSMALATAVGDGSGSAEVTTAAPDDDELVINGNELPSGVVLTATGIGLDSDRRFRHAGGVEDWAVKCSCGTMDDDGERMIVCDSCGFWMHTRCVGLINEEDDQLPKQFTCEACRAKAAEAAEPAAAGLGKRSRA